MHRRKPRSAVAAAGGVCCALQAVCPPCLPAPGGVDPFAHLSSCVLPNWNAPSAGAKPAQANNTQGRNHHHHTAARRQLQTSLSAWPRPLPCCCSRSPLVPWFTPRTKVIHQVLPADWGSVPACWRVCCHHHKSSVCAAAAATATAAASSPDSACMAADCCWCGEAAWQQLWPL